MSDLKDRKAWETFICSYLALTLHFGAVFNILYKQIQNGASSYNYRWEWKDVRSRRLVKK